MVIANFTPDEITWTHGGIIGILKTGDIKEFDNARGNHILNRFGQRGLIQMQFGDDEDEKKKGAMKIYRDFWIRQITNFNRQNQVLENEKKAYLFPQESIVQKGEEFGIEVIGPWKLNVPTSDKEVLRLKDENRSLAEKMDMMQDQMNELLKIVTTKVGVQEMEKEKFLKQFKNMSFPAFKAWIKHNLDKIEDWPDDIKDEIRTKWDNGKYGDLCPV